MDVEKNGFWGRALFIVHKSGVISYKFISSGAVSLNAIEISKTLKQTQSTRERNFKWLEHN